MATPKDVRRRGRLSLILGAVVATVLFVAVAYADNVQNDVTVTIEGKIVTVTAGGSGASVGYRIAANSGDGQAGCNASDGSSPIVTPTGLPSGVTTSPSSLTFTVCSTTYQFMTFAAGASVAPGDYAIDASVSDSGTGTYNTNPATFTLRVVVPPPPSDTTAPSIGYTLNPAAPDGANGWYKSNVSLTWTVSEPESPSSLVKIGCVDQNITTDQVATTYSCSATSDGGSAGVVNATIKRDATAPVITRDASADSCGLPGDNGWCRGTQTAGFTATDATSGIAPTGTSPVNFTQNTTTNGSAVNISSGTKSDMAGNDSNSLDAGPFKIDSLEPLNTVTGVANGQAYTLGSVPAAGCNTTDQGIDNSGVAETATPSVTGGTVNGVGTFQAKCTGGKDNAGNLADDATVTYLVEYGGVSGILQPINPDNTSLFSRGKAVPVKFRLAGDEPNGFNVSGWTLQRVKVNCTNFDSEDAAIEAVAENPSNAFRYDAGADQYINNASFKDQLAATCWKVKVTLDSGQTMESAIFRLQK
jgi:hypothetical protein